MKFVPVIVTMSPPSGFPLAGVTAVMVGAVEVGGGVTDAVPKATVIDFVALLTTAVTVNVPAVADVRVAVATPFVGVLTVE